MSVGGGGKEDIQRLSLLCPVLIDSFVLWQKVCLTVPGGDILIFHG